MELVKVTSIYDFISFIPVLLYVYAIIVLFTEYNYFLIIGCLIGHLIHRFIKIMTKDIYPEIFKRPDEARDVNAANTGGYAGNKSGFPSGHTLATSFVIYYLIFENNDGLFEYDSIMKQIVILLVAYSRVKKKAHKVIQVIAGYIIGLFLAYLIINYENSNIQEIN